MSENPDVTVKSDSITSLGKAPEKGQLVKAEDKAIPLAAEAEARNEILEDAAVALVETERALSALAKKDRQGAKAAIERAIGKLEIVLAQNPRLALAPVDVDVVTHDILASVEAVNGRRRAAIEAFDDGRLQDARYLIADLASESVVRIRSIPLASYPDALKVAAALLAEGKIEEARDELSAALGTIVIRELVFPLPLVRANAAIEKAKALSSKDARSDEETSELKRLVSIARDQLKFGQALGYATKEEMKGLLLMVDELEQKIDGRKQEAGLFDRIARLFEKATSSSQPNNKA